MRSVIRSVAKIKLQPLPLIGNLISNHICCGGGEPIVYGSHVFRSVIRLDIGFEEANLVNSSLTLKSASIDLHTGGFIELLQNRGRERERVTSYRWPSHICIYSLLRQLHACKSNLQDCI